MIPELNLAAARLGADVRYIKQQAGGYSIGLFFRGIEFALWTPDAAHLEAKLRERAQQPKETSHENH